MPGWVSVTGTNGLTTPQATARPRLMVAGIGHQRLQRCRTHERDRLLSIHALAGTPAATTLAFQDVVEQRCDLAAAAPALASPWRHHIHVRLKGFQANDPVEQPRNWAGAQEVFPNSRAMA